MEVMVEVSSIPAYVSGTAQDKRGGEEEGRGGVVMVSPFSGQSGGGGFLSGSGKRNVGSEEPEASSETSSLGNPSDEEEDDVVSSGGGGDKDNDVSAGAVFGSLSSLEDSLPIKRGLSNCFSGRSKSFANLSSVKTLQDLQKEENPFNKRRKTLIAYKLSRKNSGFYSWQNPNSMPLLALKEETNQENNSSEDEEQKKLHGRKIKAFKSTSFFSLTDL